MEKEDKINRRRFLAKTAGMGTILLAPSILLASSFDSWSRKIMEMESRLKKMEKSQRQRRINEEREKEIEYKIYNELPKHVHIAKTTGIIIDDKKGREVEGDGCGIILGDKYITMAHITNIGREYYSWGFRPHKVLEKKVTLYGKELEELVCNPSNDVAVYKLHKDLVSDLPEFPCKPTEKISMGEEVYIIGNPQLTGSNVRKAQISDLDGYDGMKEKFDLGEKNSFFGISSTIIPGDSGTPVVNKNYELMGLCSTSFYGLGYIKKIGEFKS